MERCGTGDGDGLLEVDNRVVGGSSELIGGADEGIAEGDVKSRSSTIAGVPDLRNDPLLLFFADVPSSLPEICSPSVFSILSFRRRRRSCLATIRSPPPTVLFLPSLGKAPSAVSELPMSLFIAIIRAAALLERNRPCK